MAPGDSSSAARETVDRQERLRGRYVEHPEEAWITDRGRTAWARPGDPVHVRGVPGSQDYGARWELGLHRAVGGLHDAPNPGDLLCLALATCMDSVIRMLAARHGVTLERLEVDVSADVDVRGTLLVSRQVPVGFQEMRCHVRIEPAEDADPALVGRLLAAAEHSCVNLATLKSGVPVVTTHEVG
jgi:uncharacterized OsmC-like protein